MNKFHLFCLNSITNLLTSITYEREKYNAFWKYEFTYMLPLKSTNFDDYVALRVIKQDISNTIKNEHKM